MTQLAATLSPIFPLEKDADVAANAAPLKHSAHIQIFIKLVEPVVFLQDFDQQHRNDKQSAILRGSLVVRILKQTKLKNISLVFKGYSRTEWPEGIPPKKQDFVEINDVVNHTWHFYDATSSAAGNNIKKNNETGNYDNILNGSGASVYKPLPTSKSTTNLYAANRSASKLTEFSSNLQLSPTPSHINESLARAMPSTPKKELGGNFSRRSRANSSGSISSAKKAAAARSLSPLNLFRRVTSTNHDNAKLITGPNGTTNNTSIHTNSTTQLHKLNKSATSTSIFSDLMTSTFANDSLTNLNSNSTQDLNSLLSTSGSTPENFIFQPGDYIYTFEQIVPQTYPETVKADFGFVEYFLLATIERYGAFKGNLNARLPVHIVRTQSDTSVEESEPILISRDWENQLFYDIVISSKDIILDAFLPVSFSFSPLDKVTLHRIRVYITETMEYYCKGKKIHRLEPTKKFLLAEHNGPRLPNAPKDANATKAKYMGNLLEDPEDGYISNKQFEFQVFIPSRFGNHQRLHPDTGFEKIKSNHWIKLCLRLSRMVDGKRKHYEISIDSPIHVLHKLCSHANTLLPSYDSHFVNPIGSIFPPSTIVSVNNNQGFRADTGSEVQSSTSAAVDDVSNMYHTSNIFFPKEVISSPILSPNVQPLDIALLNGPSRTALPKVVQNHQNINPLLRSLSGQHIRHNTNGSESNDPNDIFLSPKLKSNIYQPETIERSLASPQAIPLSPIISPLIRPMSFALNDNDSISLYDQPLDDVPPPEFDFDAEENNCPKYSNNKTINVPKMQPPSYTDVLKSKNSDKASSTSLAGLKLSKLSLNKSQDSLQFNMNSRLSNLNLDRELENSFNGDVLSNNEDDNSNDIASSFSFEGSVSNSQTLPSGILRAHSPKLRPLSNDFRLLGNRSDTTHILPSTVRTDNHFYNDLNQILGSEDESPTNNSTTSIEGSNAEEDHEASPSHVGSSSQAASPRSSLNHYANIYSEKDETTAMEPLLHNSLRTSISGNRTLNESTMNASFEDSFFQSNSPIADLPEQPLDSSVDITALYHRNTAGWNTFQFTEDTTNNDSSNNNQDSTQDLGGVTDTSSRLSELATESDIKTINTDSNNHSTQMSNNIGNAMG